MDIFRIAQTPIFYAPVFTFLVEAVDTSSWQMNTVQNCKSAALFVWDISGQSAGWQNIFYSCVVATSWRIPKRIKADQNLSSLFANAQTEKCF